MTVAIVAMLAILTGLSVANLAAFGTALFLLNDIKGNTCPGAPSVSCSSLQLGSSPSPSPLDGASQSSSAIERQLQRHPALRG
jgi:hypothetical protein